MGKCSLTAAIPVLSVMGVQACPLPTAVLSAQTGFPSYYCDDYTDRMDILMDEWQKMRFPSGWYLPVFWQMHHRQRRQGFYTEIQKYRDKGSEKSGHG